MTALDTETVEAIDVVIVEALDVPDPQDRERRLNYLLKRRYRAQHIGDGCEECRSPKPGGDHLCPDCRKAHPDVL
jgi:hypothetical protein